MSHRSEQPADKIDTGYETTDANPRMLAYAFVGLGVLIAVVFVAMWLLFVYFDYRSGQPVAESRQRAIDYRPPSPRLQTSPGTDLREMLEKEQQQLESYGWVNKASGIVRIPVEQAMDIVVENGLPNLPPIGAEEETPNPFSTSGMQTTPVATGTDRSRPPAPLGGPATRPPQSRQDERNTNP
ncbi:MAG TPA: hypothetical protein PLP42_11645 [Acidobacteriota bacterium]|nr:hypothetical protein [Acidobacteriota bacterium]